MCGLVGIVEHSGGRRKAELCALAQMMSEEIRHRGPDDAGTWVDEAVGVAFGFRRLSILDLSDAGHQPQVSHDGRFVLMFNGEIYNHRALRTELDAAVRRPRWAGHSDTETLLAGFAAWGVTPTLQRAVGMFAIAAWDRESRRLYLARDRFGEKPLYYGWTKGAFMFGSELKALRKYPGFDNRVDRDVLWLYAQYSTVPAPYSIYERIYKLQPGCVLSLPLADAAAPAPQALFAPDQHGGLELRRFWSLGEAVRNGLAAPIDDEGEAVDRLDRALSEAVKLQSVADVPLGAFLSGGIDSSTIVALMQKQSTRRVNTFTIGFGEAGFDEAGYAKAVANHLGTEHTELYVSAEEARDVIPDLPRLYCEPFADSSQIPTHLVSRIARQRVTVALSGDGADELFGGYTRYVWTRRVGAGLPWLPDLVRRGLVGAIRNIPAATWNVAGQRTRSGSEISRLGDKAHRLADRLTEPTDVDGLYRRLMTAWSAGADLVPGARPLRTLLDETDALPALTQVEHRLMMWDALTYLPDDLLHKVDRASMAVSLETRAPFLDHRVAELAWRLPLGMKIRGGTGKWIVRQVLDRYVPKALVERPKMGFGVPIDAWLRGPLRDWAEDLIDESRLRSHGFLNPAPIRQKWAEHLAGTCNRQPELWPVLMFQAWLR